jgi:hypothetical protein
VGDEKLAAVGARPGIRHRQLARSIVFQFGRALVLEAVTGSSRAGAVRAAALDHEIRYHAVESQTVVIASLGKIDEISDRYRCLISK